MSEPHPHKGSVYHHYGESGPGWLEVRKRSGADVTPQDVARIVEANPELVPDMVVREYVLRGLRGELLKAPGRKRSSLQQTREMFVEYLYYDLYPRLKARRKRHRKKGIPKPRSGFSPAELAHALIGKRLARIGGAMSPEAVRNLLSSLKKRDE